MKIIRWIAGGLCAGVAIYFAVADTAEKPSDTSIRADRNREVRPDAAAPKTADSNLRNKRPRPERGSIRSLPAAETRSIASNRRMPDGIAVSMSPLGEAPSGGSNAVTRAPEAGAPEVAAASHQDVSRSMPLAVLLTNIGSDFLRPEEHRLVEGMENSFKQSVEEETRLMAENPQNPEIATRFRSQAVSLHDEYLRMTLGWDRFNQLSAEAAARWQTKQSGVRLSVSEMLAE
jgi:hypothetical protein